jgi:hypothetical protein
MKSNKLHFQWDILFRILLFFQFSYAPQVQRGRVQQQAPPKRNYYSVSEEKFVFVLDYQVVVIQ